MAKYSRFYSQSKVGIKLKNDKIYVDYKAVEELRRMLSANGKLQGRQRTRLGAREQRLAALAIKRARYIGLLPYNTQAR